MFGFLFRVFLIGLVIYFIMGLVFGWYRQIILFYRWMLP